MFEQEIGPHGSLYVGSPDTVAAKIATSLTALGASRFELKYGMGGLSHSALMTNIELYGTRVIPRVRELRAEYAATHGPKIVLPDSHGRMAS
jgi:alkanesulfonate monooxygenase SsuD/methylene tetrahydromethanopterin reductase-like flavin-dependent oxidoreductase (luciferase family)